MSARRERAAARVAELRATAREPWARACLVLVALALLAAALGLRTERVRLAVVLLGIVLACVVTAAAGPVAFVALIAALWVFGGPYVFAMVMAFAAMITLHELGHYLTAKRTGMKVTEFFLFFGPEIFSFQRADTRYGIKTIPAGAYVRIIGMNNLDDTAPEDEARAYRTKSYPQRMLTITAGSIMHMIIAIVLLFGVYSTWGKNEPTGRIGVGQVVDGGAAQAAGIEANDVFVSIDGQSVDDPEQVGQIVRSHQVGDRLPIVVDRDGAVEVLLEVGAGPVELVDLGA